MNSSLFRAMTRAAMCMVIAGLCSWTAASARAQSAPTTLTLEQAIAIAMQRGPSARSAASTRDAARYRDAAFGARLLPQLSLSGDLPIYSRAIIPVVQPDGSTKFVAQQQRQSALSLQMAQRLPFTGGDLFVSSGITNINVLGQQDTRLWRSTPFEIGIRQQLFRPNALAWDTKEQDVRSDVAERQYAETKEAIAQQTAVLFFDLFAARTALSNAESNARVNDTLFTLNKGRYEVGRIGENDLLQSELAVLRSRNAVDAARLNAQRAAASLRIHLGIGPDTPLEIQVSNDVPNVVVDSTIAVREALKNGAQLRDLDLQELQQKRRLAEARRNTSIGTTVSASVGYNQTAQTVGDAYKSPLQSQQFSVGVTMPLVQWGARRAQIEAAQADQDRVATDARTTRERRAQDALFATLELEQAARLLTTAAKADSVGAKRFEVARNRYTIGRIDISNLFIAQVEKDQALENYVQALRGYWDAYYRIRRLTLYDFVKGAPIR